MYTYLHLLTLPAFHMTFLLKYNVNAYVHTYI